MATYDVNFSSQYCIVRVTYSTFPGGIQITQLSGRKTSGSRTYNSSAKTVYIGVKGNKIDTGYQQTVSLGHYVDFPVKSSFTSWSLSSPIYIYGYGSTEIRIRFPNMGNSMSNKTGDFSLNADINYLSPNINSASASSNVSGAITYSGSGSQGTQLVPSLLTASGYTQVDYVQSNGSNYVNTNFKPNGNTRVEAAFSFHDSTAQQRVFGIQDSSYSLALACYLNGNKALAWSLQNTTGNHTSFYNCLDNDIHSVIIDGKNGSYTLDQISSSASVTKTNTSTTNLLIFASGGSTPNNYAKNMRLYCFRLYDNGTLIRDMVPCRRNSDSVYGLYDIVNNVFYTGTGGNLSGTTTFNSPYVWNINSTNHNAKSGTVTGLTQNANYTCTFTVRDVIGLTDSWSTTVRTRHNAPSIGSRSFSHSRSGSTYTTTMTYSVGYSGSGVGYSSHSCSYGTSTSYGSSGTSTSTGTTAKFTMSNLQPNKTYYYSVTETDNGAAATNSSSATGSFTTPCNAPSSLSMSMTARTTSAITVSVSATGDTNAAITNYTLYYKKSSDSSYSSTSLGTSTSKEVTGLSAGTVYNFYFTATNAGGTTTSGTYTYATFGSFNLNVYNPDGSEPYTTGEAGTVQFSSDGGSSYTRLYNEPTGQYPGGTVFKAKNFEPGAHRNLSSTSGFSSGDGTDASPWSATQGGNTVLNFYTAWNRYWNDVNIYNPSGVQDYESAYFDLYTSENDSHRYDLVNEDNDMTHIYNSYFEVSNIRPYHDYYELDRVDGYDSIPTSGTYRKTFDGPNEALEVYMRYKFYTVIIRRGTGIADITAPNWGWTGDYKTNSLQYGTSLNINASLQTGYHWKNWTGTFTTTTQDYTFTVAGATDITANGEANTYTINYDANGGTGTTTSSSHTYDVAKNLTSNGFSKSGYVFLGWSTNSSATIPTYDNNESVINLTSIDNDIITLYAIWQPVQTTKIWIKVNGTWKKGDLWIKVNGTWKKAKKVYTKINGVWTQAK